MYACNSTNSSSSIRPVIPDEVITPLHAVWRQLGMLGSSRIRDVKRYSKLTGGVGLSHRFNGGKAGLSMISHSTDHGMVFAQYAGDR